MRIRLATSADLALIIDILAEAAAWLHGQGIDQWPERFPAERIAPAIADGEFFVVEGDASQPIARFSLTDQADAEFWTPDEQAEPALYLNKLAVRREARGAGAMVLRWCLSHAEQNGYHWLRFDAWKTNSRLHQYYLAQGFTHVRTVDLPHRMSGALFQRAASGTHVLSTGAYGL